jgi:cytochrome c553
MYRKRIPLFAGLALAIIGVAAFARGSAGGAEGLDWAFPGARPSSSAAAQDDRVTLAGSRVTYRASDIDRGIAIDWYPDTHAAMPAIVARGDAPKVIACGYCHLPDGAGRPENAVLAALPADYITDQVRDMRAGLRSGIRPNWLPPRLMIQLAHAVKPSDVAAAAAYFSKIAFVPRTHVVEASTIPAVTQAGFVYELLPGHGRQTLGERIVELPDDAVRFEKRDPTVTYTSYVPAGSIKAGAELALHGNSSGTVSCAACHSQGLRGSVMAPPLAGHSPTALFRQLAGFRARVRHAAEDAPMLSETEGLTTRQLIDLAAYAASLK